MTDRTGGHDSWRGGMTSELPLLVALAALWVLLWDDLSWGNVAAGALLAVVVTRVFRLPAVELAGRFNPVWFTVFLARFAADLVLSSVQVIRLALSPAAMPHAAVMAVQLRTRSDLLMTVMGQVITLTPGTLVIEVDRGAGILYVHLLEAPDAAAIEESRRAVLGIEARLIRALGSREECELLAAEHAAATGGSRT